MVPPGTSPASTFPMSATVTRFWLVPYKLSHSKPDWGLASCADSLELAIQTEQILACANGEEGSNLLVELGIETKNLDPPLLWVPWTLFDGAYIESEWEAALEDLTGFLCSSYLAGHSNCP